MWRFFVQETYSGRPSPTHAAATADCPPSGCSAPVTLTPPSSRLGGPRGAASRRHAVCLLHSQTEGRCERRPADDGGRPCSTWVRRKWHRNSPWTRTVPDPWGVRWEKGVTGKIRKTLPSSRPTGSLNISRPCTLASPGCSGPSDLTNTILTREGSLGTRLTPEEGGEPLWLQLVRRGAQLFTLTDVGNLAPGSFSCNGRLHTLRS